jgi:hypothetical protein
VANGTAVDSSVGWDCELALDGDDKGWRWGG